MYALYGLCGLYLLTLSTADTPGFSLAKYYGDHMVLQGSPLRAVIWGYGRRIGETVSIGIPGIVELSTTVFRGPGELGAIWRFILPEIDVPGPHVITIRMGKDKLLMEDVLFGDVWVCAGQSNMEFSMGGVFNFSDEIMKAVMFEEIRMFRADNVEAFVPLYDLFSVLIPWTPPTKSTAMDFSAVCLYFAMNIYKSLQRPVGLVEAAWGGTAIETWSSPQSLLTCGSSLHRHNSESDRVISREGSHVPSAHCVLWNAMIHPLLNMTIYGVLWYQGESNAGMSRFYGCAFPALISDWRQRFSGSHQQTPETFPFGFVQIGANRPGHVISGFCDIRWQQTQGFGYVPNPRLRNVFMAVAMDLPDFDCPFGQIHPRNKRDVGWRLSRSGLAVAYGESLGYQGPFPVAITAEDDSVRVDYGGESLDIRNLSGFELCCSDRPVSDRTCSDYDPSWVESPVSEKGPSVVSLRVDVCAGLPVTRIRYAWRESPCEPKLCAIYGRDSGLPAPPFILPLPFTTGTCHSQSYIYNENSCTLP